jgi:hypothetical protein
MIVPNFMLSEYTRKTFFILLNIAKIVNKTTEYFMVGMQNVACLVSLVDIIFPVNNFIHTVLWTSGFLLVLQKTEKSLNLEKRFPGLEQVYFRSL